MDTTLIANISGQYQRLDIFEDIPITLTIQQSDLTNLTNRRTPYSKTLTLPDTSSNALLFEHYFEINGTDFNPLNQIPIVVQYRGTDIFSGVMRLNAVLQTNKERLYEVYMLGDVADWAAKIRESEIQDLDWTSYTHELNYSAVTTSWEANTDGVSGLFGGDIIYPLINYGLDYQGEGSAATPSFTYSFEGAKSFSLSGNPVPPKVFKPAIRVKSVLDNIFSLTDYSVVSEFFDSDYFKSIYMDTFQNGKIGIESASAVTNQNIFRANSSQKSYRYTRSALWTGDQLRLFTLWDVYPTSYDPLNNYTNNENGYFTVPYQGDYYFNLRFNYIADDPFFIQGAFRIVAFKSTNLNNISGGTRIYESEELSLFGALTQQDVNLFFSGSCQPGEFISVFLEETKFPIYYPSIVSNRGEYRILPFSEGAVTDQLITYDLYNGPPLTGQNLVDIKLGIVNINCFDYIKGLITMFNLLIIQDEPNKEIRIEPYNWYYNEEDRELRDWTQKLDISRQVRIEPLSFDLSKDITWTYDYTDFEYLPKLWTDRNDFVYGRFRFTTQNNVFSGEQVYQLPFGSCPTSGVTGAPNFIIPQFYYLNNQQESPYATIPHLFFWVGNRYAYKDSLKTIQGSWYMLSGNTAVEWTTYPCVSHLSTLDSQLSDVISDLNFNSSFDFFGNSNTYINQFTPYTLYNVFWQDYITNIYSPETRRVSGDFFFRPIDVYETNVNDKIFIKDANYSIEKITDANLVNKTLTKISLIKDITPYYKVEPPSPIYFVEPNEGYPGVQPSFTTLCYTGLTSTPVCNSTANVGSILTFGTGVIENYSEVWYDTGTAYSPLPIGTYLKQQSVPGADTFVVVDNYGHILQINC